MTEHWIPVIYVAGPFRAATPEGVQQNIDRAVALAGKVWRLGCAALCPHANSEAYRDWEDQEQFLAGDLAMMVKCDGVLLTEDWETSRGASAERMRAIQLGMPVWYSIGELETWVRNRRM